jgi:hypothetical protein
MAATTAAAAVQQLVQGCYTACCCSNSETHLLAKQLYLKVSQVCVQSNAHLTLLLNGGRRHSAVEE